ncbi:MAG: hypothetical protein ACE5F4_02215, partial [Candidatus Paceibacteria bacterium]
SSLWVVQRSRCYGADFDVDANHFRIRTNCFFGHTTGDIDKLLLSLVYPYCGNIFDQKRQQRG